jgi:hypothetical protein
MTYDEEPAFQNNGELHQQLIAEVLAAYPDKSRKPGQFNALYCQLHGAVGVMKRTSS